MSTPTAATAVPAPRHLVLTGGPGAGKTSAMARLRHELTSRGWRVLVAPEAATLIIAGGVHDIGHLATHDRLAYLAVQTELVRTQVHLHARFTALASALGSPRTVVLHDRGLADNRAYMTCSEYDDVIRQVREQEGLAPNADHDLYDAVLHLRSAAVTADGYDGSAYTTANNTARSETATQATELDEATLDAWAGHPHLVVIGSRGSFTDKLDRAVAAVLGILGDPDPVEVEVKFLLTGEPDLDHPALAGAVRAHIEQVYLPASPAGEQRVRARTVAGVTAYTHTVKRDLADGSRVEVETPVDRHVYDMLVGMRDPATAVVRKTRHLFVVGDQRFELDQIHAPVRAWLLEAELVTTDDQVTVPEFLGPVVEVTADPRWRNRQLATLVDQPGS